MARENKQGETNLNPIKMEISFKVWDTHYKNMEENAEYGIDLGIWIPFGDLISNPRYTLLQYSGRNDKNGTKIYNKDIVKVTEQTPGGIQEWTAVVRQDPGEFVLYNPECCETCKKGVGCISTLNEWHPLEVIGNYLENPEIFNQTLKNKRKIGNQKH